MKDKNNLNIPMANCVISRSDFFVLQISEISLFQASAMNE